MEGVPGWAVLGLQGKEVESPEASGHVWCEKGGASHLKKYIYIFCTIYTKHPGSGQKSGAGSVSGLPPLPPRANLSRAHGLGQHRH